ncbi:expressed protein [Phakopsora pachyrhizi]|uniref:Expressed protein n=1 Tax=Phakopsora pachyrhizi TaxID=170000 RepID=A0AAV0AR62_PHAPC|nr:expressed protein [Phakopsora pachyrhizi]
MPVATSSVVNKTASRSASLYQNCLEARSLMRRVPGFEQGPWITANQQLSQQNSASSPSSSNDPLPIEPLTPRTPHTNYSSSPFDPVSLTLDIIRQGSSLCYLYNAILLDPISPPDLANLPPLPPNKTWKTIKPLQVVWCPIDDIKGCQKSAAHFIMALKTELGWGTEIDDTQSHGLMVNMLYDQNTNATVKVISNVLRLLHLLQSLGVLLPPSEEDLAPSNSEPEAAMDDRARVVKEILESERKYVQDLEVLQRRFLIGVEANARLPADDQRFGHLFVTLEELFSCYEPFCANFACASQLAQDENAALQVGHHFFSSSPSEQVSDILDPNYELPTFLIKPVQRICKYPLLLQQLVKHSNPEGPYYQELKDGLASITRVTDGVNETTRQRENELAVNDLKERVEDWKGHELNSFGQLVLEDTFTVVKNESEREYHVYLFERIILCCKEVGAKLDKKASKQSISLKKSSQGNYQNTNGPKRKNTQQLKGRIFIANVMSATPRPSPPGYPQHQYLLQVTWRGDTNEEYFSIRCRTEEQLKKWQAAITKAVDDSVERRRRQVHHYSSGSRSKMNSPLSQFPNTPQSDMGPPPYSAGYSHHSHHPRIPEHPFANAGHSNGAGSSSGRNFEDEEENYQTDGESISNGRNTPSGMRRNAAGHRSMPAERPEVSYGPGRARSQTDDSTNASNITQWRSHAPTASMPPVPRGSQPYILSNESHVSASLRSSTSSRHLRHKQSQEWGAASSVTGSATTFRTEEEAMLPTLPSGPASGMPMSRQSHNSTSQTGMGPSFKQNLGGIPMFRSRSASSPNIHQQPEGGRNPSWTGVGSSKNSGVPSVPSLPTSQQIRGMPLPTSILSGGRGHIKQKSSDSSVMGTDRSSTDSQRLAETARRNGSTVRSMASNRGNAQDRYSGGHAYSQPSHYHQSSIHSSSITPNSSGNGIISSSNTSSIRFKLRSGGDTYVIVSLPNIGYDELVQKVFKKLKNCGVNKESKERLRLRYEDEEGDLILICNDEDVGMAIEWMKSVGSSHLLLYVD